MIVVSKQRFFMGRDPHPVYSPQRLESFLEGSQSYIRRGEYSSGTRAIRTVPEGLGGLSQSCHRMAEQLHACRATVFLRQRRAQGHVYDERNRERELQLPQSHKEGFFPERGRCVKLLYLRVQELYQKWAGAGYQTERSFATNC